MDSFPTTVAELNSFEFVDKLDFTYFVSYLTLAITNFSAPKKLSLGGGGSVPPSATTPLVIRAYSSFSNISVKCDSTDTNILIARNYQQFLLYSERKVMTYRKLIV